MGRVLALDIGERRIGVAVSDPTGMLAQPLTVITRQGVAKDVAAVISLLQQQEATTVVVGCPYTLQGDESVAARRVSAFVNALREAVDTPVVLMDERLSTVEAERRMREASWKGRAVRGRVDAVAAALILERYLRRQGG